MQNDNRELKTTQMNAEQFFIITMYKTKSYILITTPTIHYSCIVMFSLLKFEGIALIPEINNLHTNMGLKCIYMFLLEVCTFSLFLLYS